ncbi:unnamed protein product, partial [Effrenium voratum]
GDRTSFEDFHVLDQTASLVAVFDGHLGDEAAAFCAERLPLHLAKAETASEWQEAFKACDAELRERLPQTEAGTTVLGPDQSATVVRVKESSQESNTLLSTRDHRPSDADERRRIEAAGGEVTKEDPDNPPRVDGVLSCSRALGSFELKQEALWPEEQKVSCIPDVYKWHATRGDWLILACDGIWDAASNEQVVDRVCRRATKGKDLGQVVEALLQLCSSSLDNLTLVAIELGAVEPKDDTVTMNAGDFLKARREAVRRTQYKSFGLRFGFSLEKNIPEQGPASLALVKTAARDHTSPSETSTEVECRVCNWCIEDKRPTIDDTQEGFDLRSILQTLSGDRTSFEDFHVLDQTAALVAVFDGHLGDEAAAFCAERLPLHLAKAETASEWQEAFKACDAELRERLPQTEAGTTVLGPDQSATVVRVKESSQESNTLLSTRDHRPSDADERRRIEAAGGEVTKEDPDDPPRVDGVLSCSRALGSFELKQEALWPEDQKVSCLPDFYKWHATRGDWLILACDGIWDAASNEQVVDRVCRRATKGKDLGQVVEDRMEQMFTTGRGLIAEAMLQLCSRSLDNLTLVAIELGAVEPKAGASEDEIGSGREGPRKATKFRLGVPGSYLMLTLCYECQTSSERAGWRSTVAAVGVPEKVPSLYVKYTHVAFKGPHESFGNIHRSDGVPSMQLVHEAVKTRGPCRYSGRSVSQENFDFRSIHLQNAPEFVRSSVLQMLAGDRTSFEDFHVLDQTAALVAVFDGHLGDEAAAFCAERLPLHLAKAETASEWQEAFKACDAELRERLPQTEAGTTATVVRVKESSQDALELLVGSCGDCRAVLWQKESNTLLSTRDHRPSDADERRRIEAAGGEVTKEDPDDPPRVDGVLSCSRALGSFELKQEALWPEDQKVSCLPDFHKWHATRGDWLILACDGIWDAASNEQVVDRVCRRATKGKDLGQVVEAMLQLCSSSLDNLTLVAIELGAVEPKDDTVTMNAGNFLTARREAVPRYKSFGLRFGFSLEKNIPEQGPASLALVKTEPSPPHRRFPEWPLLPSSNTSLTSKADASKDHTSPSETSTEVMENQKSSASTPPTWEVDAERTMDDMEESFDFRSILAWFGCCGMRKAQRW